MDDTILYVVPTPIGNLKDITLRALDTLNEVEIILAEDTRVSKKLLLHYNIHKTLISYHQHNEHRIVQNIIEKIKAHKKVALISDAGTPGISDAGYLLIKACVNENIEVQTLPGATALIPALINSALPNNNFVFEGFLPVKKNRQTKLKYLSEDYRTIILYESPYKIIKTLKDCQTYFGKNRLCSVSRELSKIYEETKHGTLEEVTAYFSKKILKGEFVICIQGIDKKKIHNEN